MESTLGAARPPPLCLRGPGPRGASSPPPVRLPLRVSFFCGGNGGQRGQRGPLQRAGTVERPILGHRRTSTFLVRCSAIRSSRDLFSAASMAARLRVGAENTREGAQGAARVLGGRWRRGGGNRGPIGCRGCPAAWKQRGATSAQMQLKLCGAQPRSGLRIGLCPYHASPTSRPAPCSSAPKDADSCAATDGRQAARQRPLGLLQVRADGPLVSCGRWACPACRRTPASTPRGLPCAVPLLIAPRSRATSKPHTAGPATAQPRPTSGSLASRRRAARGAHPAAHRAAARRRRRLRTTRSSESAATLIRLSGVYFCDSAVDQQLHTGCPTASPHHPHRTCLARSPNAAAAADGAQAAGQTAAALKKEKRKRPKLTLELLQVGLDTKWAARVHAWQQVRASGGQAQPSLLRLQAGLCCSCICRSIPSSALRPSPSTELQGHARCAGQLPRRLPPPGGLPMLASQL